MTDKTIKSVRRVFEILELFDKERRPLSAKEIAEGLGYPLTSAHALLKSMHELGYADFDAPRWSYLPSSQLFAVSEWASVFMDREPQLLACMRRLNEETRETINLSRLLGSSIKIIYGLESLHAVGVSVRAGTMMPANKTITGSSAIASFGGDEYVRYKQRLARNKSKPQGQIAHGLIAEARNSLANCGAAIKCDAIVDGIGAMCVPIKTRVWGESMVMGIVGPSERIKKNYLRYHEILRSVIPQFDIDTLYPLRRPKN